MRPLAHVPDEPRRVARPHGGHRRCPRTLDLNGLTGVLGSEDEKGIPEHQPLVGLPHRRILVKELPQSVWMSSPAPDVEVHNTAHSPAGYPNVRPDHAPRAF
jgi:hypothetical protein